MADEGKNVFNLVVLTPDKCFIDVSAQEVIFDTSEGRIGVMAGHMPMVAAVVEGVIDILRDGEWKRAACSQGFVKINGKAAEFFVDSVEWADEIDCIRAKEAFERAKARLKSDLSQVQHLQSQAAMARAMARLKAAGS